MSANNFSGRRLRANEREIKDSYFDTDRELASNLKSISHSIQPKTQPSLLRHLVRIGAFSTDPEARHELPSPRA